MPGVAPVFVLADTDIIKEAPLYLALSGAGDIFGKYTALADWKIAHALTGEYFCPVIEKMDPAGRGSGICLLPRPEGRRRRGL